MEHGKNRLFRTDEFLAVYMRQVQSKPLLSAEEEQEMALRIAKGDTAAKNRLVECNLRLVAKIALAFKAAGVPLLDLIQEGSMGLMRAAEKFDATKNSRFSTYATFWIRQSINRYIENKRRTIRLPARKEETLKRIHSVFHSLCQSLGRLPKIEEIANTLHISCEEVQLVMDLSSGIVSLDGDVDSDEKIGLAAIQEDYTYCPVRELLRKTSRSETIRFLGRLKERERRIIMYRYQFLNGPRTFKKIGERLGLSAEAVRQIEIRALRKIRQGANELRDCVYA